MTVPRYLQPFVLDPPPATRERVGLIDVYLPDSAEPDSAEPAPAILFVHGGPLQPEQTAPRDWPVFVGYGNLAAAAGLVGVTVDHPFHGLEDLAQSAETVTEAIGLLRNHPRVDPERVALWFFSNGGLLSAEWLRSPMPWLHVVALTYPRLGTAPEWGVPARFDPVHALDGVGDLPIVLTMAGQEREELAGYVDAFITAAQAIGAGLEVIDVPAGEHGFDHANYSDESRDAVTGAMAAVRRYLTR